MKHVFQINHLDCANCAHKIEVALNKEDYIEEANLNFVLKRLTVVSKQKDIELLRSQIEKLANNIERGVKVLLEADEEEDEGKVIQHEVEDEGCRCEGKHCCSGHSHEREHNHSHGHSHEDERGDEYTHNHEHQHGHSESHVHSHEYSTKKGRHTLELSENGKKGIMFAGLGLFAVGLIVDINAIHIIAYLLVGYDIVYQAFKNLLKGRMLDENFLMAAATFAAFAIGEYPEAVAVMAFYKIGEYMQEKAVGYSRKEIAKAMDIRPDFARVIRNGQEIILAPQKVRIGDLLEIRAGEKLPLDGEVVEGRTLLDTSMLTGEAVPVVAEVGSKVLSGSINKEGVIKVKVTTSFKESTVSKILELIENATNKKSTSENFITKFAKWYTPIVVGMAVFIAIVPSIITGNSHQWIYSAIVFLVISCPCAVVVSVPLGFFAGLGSAAHKGVLVKGSNYLEALNTMEVVVLDKTGTVTKGRFGVTHILVNEEGAASVSKEKILEYVACLEQSSNHPIARSIIEAYHKEKTADKNEIAAREYTKDHAYEKHTGEAHAEGSIGKISNLKEISGEGIIGEVEGEYILAGNAKLMERHGIKVPVITQIGSYIYVAKAGQYLGCIVVADQIKEDSKQAISSLKTQGIKKVVMLTGDKKEIAEAVGKEVGVDEVYSELLPQDKVERFEEVLKTGKAIFVGDGINDAPVLARADVGIAMGGVGSDAAIEAADVVLMTDELSSIGEVLGVARRTRQIVTQNIIFAIGVKILVMILSLFGVANMWLAVFADVGVALLAIMNSIRVLSGNLSYVKKMFTARA